MSLRAKLLGYLMYCLTLIDLSLENQIKQMVFDLATLIGLVQAYGYLGVFLSSLISSAVLFIPVPYFLFVVTAGALLNPFWVGISAGLGAAIGEMIGYPIGRGLSYSYWKKQGKKKKYHKGVLMMIKDWFDKKRGPIIIFIFAVTPLPDDLVVLFCGIIKYDIKKLFLVMLAGKIIFSLVLAYAGFYGIDFIIKFFT